MAFSCISVRGARVHNLKGVDVDIPHHALTVITGLSGSGKSSLAFDTLYAEGQRRYVETFSPYTRQFLERVDKPDVDSIEGIPPALAIEQANAVRTSRSTVGTMTEIADHLKLLFPRLARARCPVCDRELRVWTTPEIAADAAAKAKGDLLVAFAVPFPEKTPLADAAEFVRAQGFLRVWRDGKAERLDELAGKAKFAPRELVVIQDRIAHPAQETSRLLEAIEAALRFGKGQVRVLADGAEHRYGTTRVCPHDGATLPEPTPALFSFNHPTGACPTCRGFGRTIEIDYDRALPDRSLTIRQGVVKAFQGAVMAESQRDLLRACRRQEIDIDTPFARLPKADQRFVIDGELSETRTLEDISESGGWYGVKGFFQWLESKSYKMHVRVMLSRYRSYRPCPACGGTRFQPVPLRFFLRGKERDLTIAGLNALPLAEALDFVEALPLPAHDEPARRLRQEVALRLGYLRDVGLGYLTLDRATRTLSGGEIARVNLTSCLGNSLVNTLFVLDEPTIGLHPRDTGMLLDVIGQLRDRGNTVVLVEHDENVMARADHIVDLGPGRGEQGGTLLYSGPHAGLLREKESLTGRYLSGRASVPVPARRRAPKPGQALRIEGAKVHNLDGLDVEIPLGLLVAVTGVSGSGKSSLVHEVLYENLAQARRTAKEQGTMPDSVSGDTVARLTGHAGLADAIRVDQSPLTRTSRSNPILYLGAFGPIRDLFAQTEEAEAQGLNAGSFSFNGGTGRCPRCGGAGVEKIEMQFLADVFLTCPTCEGKRFQPHVLAVSYRGRNIDEVLNMTVEEARAFFAPQPSLAMPVRKRHEEICAALDLLRDVGLAYLRLGQPLNQLSGGEAQRIKLVSHLVGRGAPPEEEEEGGEEEKPASKKEKASAAARLFILDEPTTGLHFEDVRLLVAVFQRMVERGDTVLVIEHNLDVIKCADWLIELGPEAGAGGGKLVAQGTPEQVAADPKSPTGKFLREKLGGRRLKEAPPAPKRKALPNGSSHAIGIHNARHHNLKGVSVEIERDAMTVVTGLSGSGKSTLAFDILFAEGQRRYLDSLNAYARQFVEQMEKPAVDSVTGIPPAVAIEQRVTRGGGKSTVATVTEVHQFLRLLYAKLGTAHDPDTGEAAVRQTPAEVAARLRDHLKKAGELTLLAPLIKARKGLHTEIAKWAAKKGYPALRVDGKWIEPAKFKALDRFTEHTLDVVLGNLSRKQGEAEQRKLIETALALGRDTLYVLDNRSRETIYSTALYCPGSGRAFDELDPRLFSFNSPHGWCPECQGYGTVAEVSVDEDASELEKEVELERAREGADEAEELPCPSCHGARLNPTARAVRLPYGGGKWAREGGPTLPDLGRLSISDAAAFFAGLKWKAGKEDRRARAIGRDILPEIAQRLAFLEEVGLGYLTLDRAATTLSGGESQRIRLAAQLGSNLQGVLYVLDEPTIGLHPRDNARLLDSLDALKAKGNTLVVVEHDEETMKRADRILDLGPGAGRHGGRIIADGTWKQLAAQKDGESATAALLGNPLRHPMRGSRRPCNKETDWLTVTGARVHNLQEVTAKIPLGRLTVLCGLSGAGKSTLLHEVIKPAVQEAAARKRRTGKKAPGGHGPWDTLAGAEGLSGVCEVDASPIGKTSRSTPATYLGLMDELRALFAQMPLARQRGYTASRFSFNSGDGRCESCLGQGSVKVEMQFLPTVLLPCEACGGLRYKPDTLEVLFNGKNVAQVLGMSIDEGVEFFSGVPRLQRPLELLRQTGLGYLTLGQPSPTLSGGEAQRLKLVTQLFGSLEGALKTRLKSRVLVSPKQLFLLEEPTIGLHLADVKRLLEVLHGLCDAGHTVLVIEHHLDVIAEADHVIELGPGAGASGGRIVAAGTPEDVARGKTATAPFLKATLKG